MSRPPSQIRYGNRIVQQKQQTETLQRHYQSLKRARPLTGNTIDRNIVMINNKKKEMVQENKYTEIQRQNRILFQKITTIMNKGTISQSVGIRDRSMNKTLNGIYRKKQMQKIQHENAKMLKRLKEKRSSYGVVGLQRQWQKKKKVIQNMSLYPFILNDKLGGELKRQEISNQYLVRHKSTYDSQRSGSNKEVRRIRKIDGCMFLITIRFEGDKMYVIGDIKQQQNIKVIELDRRQGQSFIVEECNGNIENVFGLLRYDRQSGDLYLVGREVGEMERVKEFEQQRRKSMSQNQKQNKYENGNENGVRKSLVRHYLASRGMTREGMRKNKNRNVYTMNDNINNPNNEQEQDIDMENNNNNNNNKSNNNKNNPNNRIGTLGDGEVPSSQRTNKNNLGKQQQQQQIRGQGKQLQKKQKEWVKVEKKRQSEQQLQLRNERSKDMDIFMRQQQQNVNYEQQQVNEEIN